MGKVIAGSVPDTFGLSNCRDLLRKFRRDIERLKASNCLMTIYDAAYDCAVVGTHLADWVARDLALARQQPKGTPARVSADMLAEITGNQKETLRKALFELAELECPAVDVCRTYANGGKHAERNNRAAEVRMGIIRESAAEGQRTDSVNATELFLILYDAGEPIVAWSADRLFAKVYEFWESIILATGLGREH